MISSVARRLATSLRPTALSLRQCSTTTTSATPTTPTASENMSVEAKTTAVAASAAVPGMLTRDDIFTRYPPQKGGVVREAWVETLDTIAESKSGDILRLHPEVWSVKPRMDLIKANLEWQLSYKHMSYEHAKSRHEMPPPETPGRPWQKKGTGRARHSSIRSPLWKDGGKAFGPRGVKTWYYNLEYTVRVQGLIHTLAVKYAQDDVRIVRDLEIPTNESKYLEDLVDERGWSTTTLFVDAADIFPANITEATDSIFHMNLVPVYGLNVHSMLKHKTLVLTVDAVKMLEEKLIFAHRRLDVLDKRNRSNNPEYSIYHKFR